MINNEYLKPGQFIESDDPQVIAFAQMVVANETEEIAKAVRLYEAVRDRVVYDPYDRLSRPEAYSGKRALYRGRGFCISKAALLASCARAIGIPARVGFADVRNHLASPRLIRENNGDIFRWHSYTELYLDEKWVKATPAFDSALCKRCGIQPLAFDGLVDSIFHSFDGNSRRHMEYVQDRGVFADVPVDAVMATFREYSPAIMSDEFGGSAGAFAEEAQVP